MWQTMLGVCVLASSKREMLDTQVYISLLVTKSSALKLKDFPPISATNYLYFLSFSYYIRCTGLAVGEDCRISKKLKG